MDYYTNLSIYAKPFPSVQPHLLLGHIANNGLCWLPNECSSYNHRYFDMQELSQCIPDSTVPQHSPHTPGVPGTSVVH